MEFSTDRPQFRPLTNVAQRVTSCLKKSFSRLFSPRKHSGYILAYFLNVRKMTKTNFIFLVLPFLLTLLTPPPLELISDFSDGGEWFEFEWWFKGWNYKYNLLGKTRKPKENLRFKKSFQTGQAIWVRWGNKVNKNSKNSSVKKLRKKIQKTIFLIFFEKKYFFDLIFFMENRQIESKTSQSWLKHGFTSY